MPKACSAASAASGVVFAGDRLKNAAPVEFDHSRERGRIERQALRVRLPPMCRAKSYRRDPTRRIWRCGCAWWRCARPVLRLRLGRDPRSSRRLRRRSGRNRSGRKRPPARRHRRSARSERETARSNRRGPRFPRRAARNGCNRRAVQSATETSPARLPSTGKKVTVSGIGGPDASQASATNASIRPGAEPAAVALN